jgi:UDP-2,3-diacylglucosamine hydrolase
VDAGARVGLIAGNGRLPFLFAEAARRQGVAVVAVAHREETDPALAAEVERLEWVRVGQVDRILRTFRQAGVERAVMAGGIGRVRALTAARPDLGAVRIIASLRSFRDDALLRAVAGYFERHGVRIEAPTAWLREVLAPAGLLAGPVLSEAQAQDVALGWEVAGLLGQADVGQTVVVKGGHVLALEAVEGTDEAIRRGARLGGPGAVVVKRAKPGQDERFDLPAVGPATLALMREVGAVVLAVEAGRTVVLDAAEVAAAARRADISVWGVDGASQRTLGV